MFTMSVSVQLDGYGLVTRCEPDVTNEMMSRSHERSTTSFMMLNELIPFGVGALQRVRMACVHCGACHASEPPRSRFNSTARRAPDRSGSYSSQGTSRRRT